MFPKIPFIPRVTTSRKDLINYIKEIYEWYNIYGWVYEDEAKEWIRRVQEDMVDAHYFEGLIFIDRLSPYLIFHELVHHISRILKMLTHTKIWYRLLDTTIDELDILIFQKE